MQGFKTPDLVFFTGRQNSALPRMAVVPNRNDVLKQDYLQSFKNRGLGFACGKFAHRCQNQNRHGWRWFQTETMF
ncbi:hypothetical protein [Treponema phagedenis]|uniref:Uncharacterized protein n=1 Tax=Treponema phagedenis TaxID=162 RepID=A0AAE6IVM9_TREPH|nr:hypothetical protein [Treponema phagedenis]NVP24368.1 hypothetical protein [Treponema phagedenis]QEJ96063.1 hypothetical protein FUT79_13205 [Treponema phagedenis]QEJ99037.1 hypothetical protein FUT82_14255 [Treponema phagedenis]QEK01826.1 hypothetical protein FUT84_12120 [Treponema phagedenis]QEK04548.1 hypothetical protein FUT83_12565 [Treponema phagedenis]